MPATELTQSPQSTQATARVWSLDAQAQDARVELERRVEGVRARSRVKFLATGICLGLAVFIAAFLGFSLADILFKFTPSGRFISLSATLCGLVAVGYWFIVRPWTRLGGSVEVARNVESAYPQLEEQLSTALEYGRSEELGAKTSSPALVGALMRQVAQKAEPLDFKRTIRWKEFAIALALAFAFALAVGTYYAKDSRLFALTLSRFLNPTGDFATPTLTVIKAVEPGDDPAKNEVPVETTVPVVVELDGRMPPTATLSVWLGEGDSGRWEDRVMDRGEDGKYRATLRRLLENTRYRIKAGDAESPEFKIAVYKLPEISEFNLRLEHPAYTGRGTETLAPGVGDVRALAGTVVHVDVLANTDLSSARVQFKSGREKISGVADNKDARRSTLSFAIDKDDEYQIEIANTRNKTATGSLYLVKALKDRVPKITIRKPEKDLMVHRGQTVNVEMTAEDDVGVREIGIFHSLGVDETKVMVRRLDPTATRADGKLVWELSNLGLKGGEVIAYYAYALDNDLLNPKGPKQSKSDIHFLTVYDEEEYDSQQNPKDPKQPRNQSPPAVKQLDKLIDVQKKLLKDTFAQARQREQNAAQGLEMTDAEKQAAQKTAAAQAELKARVDALLKEIKAELEKEGAEPVAPRGNTGTQGNQLLQEDGEGPRPPQPPQPPQPQPQGSGMGEKEVKHLETALARMDGAIENLKRPDAPAAVRPENEALRSLSETRRLLLSDQEGDPRFRSAANQQSKKRQQQDQSQQQQDQQQAREELAEMPKMMEKEKQIERELEQLQERKRQNPPSTQAQNEEQKREQDEQRRLERKAQDELEKLAKEAEDRSRKLEQLAQRNPDMQAAADKMQDAARSLRKAAEEAKKPDAQNTAKAQENAQTAQSETKDAQRSLRNALEKQIRNELANAAKDAQELAQKQNDLAQQMRQMNQQQQNGQQQQGQQQQGQQQQGQQQGQQQSGQQQGQQQSGQQQGQQAQGQQQGQQGQQGQQQGQQAQGQQSGQQQGQQGQQAQGQQSGQQSGQQGQQAQSQQGGQSGQQGPTQQQQMAGMGRQQRDIQNDLKELADRLKGLSERAGEKGLGGASQIEQAGKQSGEGSAASDAAKKAQEALNSGKKDEAQREAAKAGKALDQMAQSLQEAVSKTNAGDMKELAASMRKLQGLVKEQGDINKDASQGRDASQLASREEKVRDGAREAADAAAKLDALRKAGRERSAAAQLDQAAQQAAQAANALKNQDTTGAKEPGEKAERALNLALNDMEMAAGATLQEKAREAQNIARAAREKQADAAEGAKQIKEPDAQKGLTPEAAQKRDEVAAQQQQAARDARRLENALEGLQEIAKEANPAAAEIAREARENMQRADVQKAMEDIARGLDALGQKKENKAAELKPSEAAKKGEELGKTLKDVEKNLDDYIAEAVGSQLDRLRAMEAAAREAAEKSKQLAKNDEAQKGEPNKNENPQANNQKGDQKGDQKGEQPGKQPNEAASKGGKSDSEGKADGEGEGKGKPSETAQKQDPKNSDTKKPGEKDPSERMKELARELQRLQPRLERLEANAPERVKMREAVAELDKMREPSQSTKADPNGSPTPGVRNTGGPNFQRIAQNLDEVVGGLHERVERIQRARDIRPEPDEEAPKEYRQLVDRYYRALSEDTEQEKK